MERRWIMGEGPKGRPSDEAILKYFLTIAPYDNREKVKTIAKLAVVGWEINHEVRMKIFEEAGRIED